MPTKVRKPRHTILLATQHARIKVTSFDHKKVSQLTVIGWTPCRPPIINVLVDPIALEIGDCVAEQ
eukprot:COSAG01_NODE_7931_length_2987_cov_4.433172_2_plen_66_part_00